MLIDASPEFRGKVAGLFLFGTPMGGSIYANWASFFSRNWQIIQLVMSADPDRITNRAVKDWVNKQINVPSFCAFEKSEPIVVDKISVQPLCNAALRELNVGHFKLVKPADAKSDQHHLLQEWYNMVFKDSPSTTLQEEETSTWYARVAAEIKTTLIY